MAELAKKLHLKKGTTEHLAKAYSTTAEAGAEYITNKIDGVTAYVAIGATNDSRATMGRVTKNGTKAILTMGKPPYAKKSWTTPGTYSFTVPASITQLRIEVAGGGGGGGGGYVSQSAGLTWYGGNGGTGEGKKTTVTVTPNFTVSITVGGGGKLSQYDGGGGDGDSSVVSYSRTNNISARGGGGGKDAKSGISGYHGEDGISYNGGGKGGQDAYYGMADFSVCNGQDGWVIIEYGGDI